MKIKMLNTETINKIAAGEVIIRPVSVIKELVENAIDAGATRITVELEAGGKNLMLVQDNGCGIAYNEVPLAFKRHATSKLSSIDDLETLDSLGFRGEALSSVCAVAKVQITTCSKEESVGSVALFEGGHLVNQRVCSYGQGTEIKVWDLFYTTPARRKHLEKDKKEEGLIRNLLEKLVISNPAIAFEVKANQRTVLRTPGTGKLMDVMHILYGEETGLLLLDFDNEPMKLRGYIGDISSSRSHKEDQIFFINGRYVKSPRLSQALDAAYEGYTMKHQHPLGVIFLELPGRMLDINIHPAKTEIKILNESLVALLFKQGIRETLKNANLVVDISVETQEKKALQNTVKNKKVEEKLFQKSMLEEKSNLDSLPLNALIEEKTEERSEKKPLEKKAENKKQSFKILEKADKKYDGTKKNAVKIPDFLAMKIVGQLFNTYILLESEGAIFLIDQHAAHERFLTQELQKIFDTGDPLPSQLLITPIPIKIRPKDMPKMIEIISSYEKIGYHCDVFGEDSIIVRSVPVLLGEPQTTELLKKLMEEDLRLDAEEAGLFSIKLKNKIIKIACKAAIKGRQPLKTIEIQHLLEEILSLDNPYTCPHGRPIIARLNEYELMKLFKRVV